MTFELNAAFSLSVGIGAVISCIRLKRADAAYIPFFILLWAGFITEIASLLLMKEGYTNVALYDIFSLLEAVLILWQFKRWKLFGKNIKVYYSFQLLFVICWTTELIFRGGLNQFTSYFIIGYSSAIVFIAISMLNGVVFKDSTALFLNPVFIICMGLIVYFTYMALVEIFWLYGLNMKPYPF